MSLCNARKLIVPPTLTRWIERRLIGRRFDDPIVKKDVESWPFKVVEQGGSPVVEVEYLGENKTFTPQEISSMVLMKVSLRTSSSHS